MTDHDPIHTCIERWHQHLHGGLPGGLDALLHEDCVFLSPIVFTPQKGREITKLYLGAAGNTLGGDESPSSDGPLGGGSFGYSKQILEGNHAMLEFETSIEGKYVNGVDIITCDDERHDHRVPSDDSAAPSRQSGSPADEGHARADGRVRQPGQLERMR